MIHFAGGELLESFKARAYSTYRGIPVQKESLKIKELINEL